MVRYINYDVQSSTNGGQYTVYKAPTAPLITTWAVRIVRCTAGARQPDRYCLLFPAAMTIRKAGDGAEAAKHQNLGVWTGKPHWVQRMLECARTKPHLRAAKQQTRGGGTR